MQTTTKNKSLSSKHFDNDTEKGVVLLNSLKEVTRLNAGNTYKINFQTKGGKGFGTTFEVVENIPVREGGISGDNGICKYAIAVVCDEKRMIFKDANKLQKYLCGEQNHRTPKKETINEPKTIEEARERAIFWTENSVQKVKEAATMFEPFLTEDEKNILKNIAARYTRVCYRRLASRINAEEAEKAAARRAKLEAQIEELRKQLDMLK